MVKLRRISLIESYILESKDLTLEAKKDLDDLRDYLGDDLFDSYMKIRDKISDPSYKDFSKLKKMGKKDIRDFVSSFQSKSDKKKQDKSEGADKLYEDDEWVVYKITTYPAAQLYGKGTKWCITGRYPGHEDRGEGYFNSYIRDEDLDGGYYFYISKEDPDEKYCLLQGKDGTVKSVWDAPDTDQGNTGWDVPSNFPKVNGINLDPKPFKWLIKTLVSAITENASVAELKSIIKQIKGFNLSLDENEKLNPLISAVRQNNYKAAKLLLDNGADPNVKMKESGETPIFFASNDSMIELLLKYNADVNLEAEYTYPYSKILPLRYFKDGSYSFIETKKVDNEEAKELRHTASLFYNKMNDEYKLRFIKKYFNGATLDYMLNHSMIPKEGVDKIRKWFLQFEFDSYFYDDLDPDAFLSHVREMNLKPKELNMFRQTIKDLWKADPSLKEKCKGLTDSSLKKASVKDLVDYIIDLWDHCKREHEHFLIDLITSDSLLRNREYMDVIGNARFEDFIRDENLFSHVNDSDLLSNFSNYGISESDIIKYFGTFINS